MDNTQKFNVNLEDIVSEYYSSNKFIKRIFFNRHKIALSYLQKIKAKRILDGGCGDGLFTSKIKNLNGVDKDGIVSRSIQC